MKPKEGRVQRNSKENASTISAPNLGGIVRQFPQYLFGKFIMVSIG
ncbi:hypothetical protein VU04_06915 [Desulfobulbus sp. TB]|nr:hypothetical protein [Desulfobulbus sp. TB]